MPSLAAKEKWADKISLAMGGPLKMGDIQEMLKNPNSFLMRTLTVFLGQKAVSEMQKRWTIIFNLIDDLKHHMHKRVHTEVVSDDEEDYSEKDVERADTAIVFPKEITTLHNEIEGLEKQVNKLAKDLDVSKKQQQQDFYKGIAELQKLSPETANNLKFTTINDAKQKEISEMYANKAQDVDNIMEMSKESLDTEHRDVLGKAVDYKAELTMADMMLKREGDENLKPSQVKALSKAVTGNYIKQERENHQTARELSHAEKNMATKTQALAEQMRAFQGGYKIPLAPPPPSPAKKASPPRLEM